MWIEKIKVLNKLILVIFTKKNFREEKNEKEKII